MTQKTPIEWEKKSRGKNPSGGGGVKLYKYPFPLDLWQKYFDKRYFGDEGLYSWRSEDVKKDVKDFISSLLKQQIEEVRESLTKLIPKTNMVAIQLDDRMISPPVDDLLLKVWTTAIRSCLKELEGHG